VKPRPQRAAAIAKRPIRGTKPRMHGGVIIGAEHSSTVAAGRDENGQTLPHSRNDVTAAEVLRLAGLGLDDREIAVVLNMRPSFVRLWYRRELETGALKITVEVAQAMLRLAKSGKSLAASVFWLKSRAGWRDGSDNAGRDGTSLTVRVVGGLPGVEPGGEG